MLKNSPVVPTFTNLNPQKCYSLMKTYAKLQGHFGDDEHAWPDIIQRLKDTEKEFALSTLGMTIAFLEEALIDDKTIRMSTYEEYQPEGSHESLQYMVLDSQALQHLEIIESASGAKDGSLFGFLDHC
mmetsp:Transcript_21387/g.33079  ORF Transcript_21387/g.33079 Transcript_21387/m.33079 type:complete len:128 (+) Transcript_21387:1443-1826(+)